MIKIRLRFSKSGPLRFIGHLDFLKGFQQTIRRAGLPMAYSQGFNPHMLLSFAMPLPLGMTSHNDYADITLESWLTEAELSSRLNKNAPEGLKIIGAWEYDGPGAAALVTAADYSLTIERPPETIRDITQAIAESINSLLSRQSIIVPKKTKSGIKDTDIRQDILDIWPQEGEEESLVMMRLAAGSARFLNPLIVAGLLLGHDVGPSSIVRIELYRQTKDGSKELSPLYEAPIY